MRRTAVASDLRRSTAGSGGLRYTRHGARAAAAAARRAWPDWHHHGIERGRPDPCRLRAQFHSIVCPGSGAATARGQLRSPFFAGCEIRDILRAANACLVDDVELEGLLAGFLEKCLRTVEALSS